LTQQRSASAQTRRMDGLISYFEGKRRRRVRRRRRRRRRGRK
jgi:hypothetical protein